MLSWNQRTVRHSPHSGEQPVTLESWRAHTLDIATIAAATVSLLAFCALLIAVRHGTHPILLDSRAENIAQSIRSRWLTLCFRHITELASFNGIALLVLVAAVLLYVQRRRRLAGWLVGVAVLDGVVVEIFKQFAARARPAPSLALVHELSFSFPSGHTTAAFLCWGVIAYFVVRSCVSSWSRRLVVAGYIVLALAVASSRVYLGAHYLSDVVGGALLGSALLGLFVVFVRRINVSAAGTYFDKRVVRAIVLAALITILSTLFVPRFFI